MTSKSDKEKKVSGKIISDTNKTAKKESPKPAKKDEDDDDELEDDIEETSPKQKAGKASSKKGEKVEAEEEWDPDFAEFDVPKSKGKKAVTPVKKGGGDEDDFKVDDEFKDMFNDGDELNDEEDDY